MIDIYRSTKNKKLHAVGSPAWVVKLGDEILMEAYYINHKLHNENGPAFIRYHNGKVIEQAWYLDDVEQKRELFL